MPATGGAILTPALRLKPGRQGNGRLARSISDWRHRMFKKLWIAFGVLGMIVTVGGCAASPGGDTAGDQAKLQSDALSWFEHYAKADGDGLANLYAEDALLMPPGAPAVKGRSGIKTYLSEDAAKSKATGISVKN